MKRVLRSPKWKLLYKDHLERINRFAENVRSPLKKSIFSTKTAVLIPLSPLQIYKIHIYPTNFTFGMASNSKYNSHKIVIKRFKNPMKPDVIGKRKKRKYRRLRVYKKNLSFSSASIAERIQVIHFQNETSAFEVILAQISEMLDRFTSKCVRKGGRAENNVCIPNWYLRYSGIDWLCFKYIYLLSSACDYLVRRLAVGAKGQREGGASPVKRSINKRVKRTGGIDARSTFTLLIEIIQVTRCSTRISGSHGIHLLDKCTYTYMCVFFFYAYMCLCVYGCACVCMCVYIYICIYNLYTRTTVTITTTAIMITTDNLCISLSLSLSDWW